jgi:DnaJ-class molecular chaperone
VPKAFDLYAELQVHPVARREVIQAAFEVLREMLIVEEPDDAAHRLARLNEAHRVLADDRLRAAYDERRSSA